MTARFLYDGLSAIADYNSSNMLQRRYVHAPGMDQPIVWYEGSGTSDRRWLLQDQLGSVVATTNSSGAQIGSPNAYDEYGQPGASNSGRFQYTGQMWIDEAGLYHYKLRAYIPSIGRFAQTDPILYAGGMNLYAYVRNDPINFVDPLGLQDTPCLPPWCTVEPPIDVEAVDDGCPATENCFDDPHGQPALGGTRGTNQTPQTEVDRDETIVVVGRKRRQPETHYYGAIVPTLCSASAAFNSIMGPSMSAPGAPAARPGFTPRITLSGGNPISQYVDPATMTIVNTTLEDHIFHPGTVVIQVVPQQGGTSDIWIRGTGTGEHALTNNVVGLLFFGHMANSVATSCTARYGIVPMIP